MSDCAFISKIASLVQSRTATVGPYRGLRFHGGRDAAEGVVLTDVGAVAGVRSRSVAGCQSTSRMMRPCGSHTKPSTKLFMCKVAVRCGVNCPPVCVPVERCGCRVRG